MLVHSTIRSKVELRCRNFDFHQINGISCSTSPHEYENPHSSLICYLGDIISEYNSEFTYEKTASSYECISFVQSSLVQLPFEFFTKHSYMKVLNAKNLGIKAVSRGLFEKAKSLKNLRLNDNHITGLIKNYIFASRLTKIQIITVSPTELEDFLFSGATNLLYVGLANNQISVIGKDTFEGQLVEIDLSGNRLTNLYYETFSQLNSLTNLLLSHNNIILKYGMFPKQLQKLDLSYNQLENFSISQLVNLNLKELKLNGNSFDYSTIDLIFPRVIMTLKPFGRLEVSDCFRCQELAYALAYFSGMSDDYHIFMVEFNVEKKNGANINGISCAEEYDVLEKINLSKMGN